MVFTDDYRGNSLNIQSVCPAVTCYVLKPLYAKHIVYGLSLLMLWVAYLWKHDFKMLLRLGDLPMIAQQHSFIGHIETTVAECPSLPENKLGRETGSSPALAWFARCREGPYSPGRDRLIENLKCWAELVFIHQKCDFSKEKRHSESFCCWRAGFPYQGICTSTYTLPCCVLKGFPAQPNTNMLAEFSSWWSAFQHL